MEHDAQGWEYLWRETYWSESDRTDDYITTFQYRHVWQPDLKEEVPFPDQAGVDSLGERGWELVAVVPSTRSYPVRSSPQQGVTYSSFAVQMLWFKRRLIGP